MIILIAVYLVVIVGDIVMAAAHHRHSSAFPAWRVMISIAWHSGNAA